MKVVLLLLLKLLTFQDVAGCIPTSIPRNCKAEKSETIKTQTGEECIFPFLEGSLERNECVDHLGEYSWCAVSLKSDCSFNKWAKCVQPEEAEETETVESCKTSGNPNPGRECVFPFSHEGKIYNKCAPFKNKFWCSFQFEYSSRDWGYCDNTICPIGPDTTTESTATSIQITTEMVQWEETQTTINIEKTGNRHECKISFEFKMEKGVHTQNVESQCKEVGSVEDALSTFGNHTFQLTSSSGVSVSCSVVAIFLENGLSTEVLETTLKCHVKNDQCLTIDGESYPSKCQFPFVKNGRKYKGCTDVGSKDSSRLWCATEVSSTSEALMGQWGYCNERCGYCGGSDEQTRIKSETPCGYNCLINLGKTMEPETVGMDPSLLPAPTLTDTKNKLSDWNKLSNNQFRFLKGQPGVFLTCKNVFNHFACHQNIFINCTGDYRFSVYSTLVDKTPIILEKIAEDIPNTHLGCNPCPTGFQYKAGYESRSYETNLGSYEGVQDESQCKEKCEALECETFAFSRNQQMCKLHANEITKPSKPIYKDYKMCVRSDKDLCPSAGKCGTNKKTRIVNGQNAGTTEHPWMACLSTVGTADCLCGGSLISTRWVLTAAHCQYSLHEIQQGLPLIHFNVHDFDHLQSINLIMANQIQSSGIVAQYHPQAYIHPMNGNQGNLAEDILFIRLSLTVQLGLNVQIITLPNNMNGPDRTNGQIDYTVYGWGAREFCYTEQFGINFPSILQKTELRILPPADCHTKMDSTVVESWYATYFADYQPYEHDWDVTGFNPNNGWKFCAESNPQNNQRSSGCYGDSGSPLVHIDGNNNAFVVGVLSHGTDCLRASQGFPGQAPLPHTTGLPTSTVFADVVHYSNNFNLNFNLHNFNVNTNLPGWVKIP